MNDKGYKKIERAPHKELALANSLREFEVEISECASLAKIGN